MKIAIDVSQLVFGGGVADYTRELVKGLAKIDQTNQYLLFGFSFRQVPQLRNFSQEVVLLNSNFQSRFWPIPISLAEWWGNQIHRFDLEKLIGPIDLYHSSDWIQFPARAKKVTTVHDFSFYKYPQTAHPKIAAVMSRRLKHVAVEADGIIAVSQATAQAGIELADLPAKKIKVIYEAADQYSPSSKAKMARVKKQLGLTGPYFVVPANLDPRKNVARVFEAWAQFARKRPDWTLVVTGLAGWSELKKPKTGRVILAGYLPFNDFLALFSGARGLIYPSLDEGFGQPILEGMQLGVPVLTSNLSSMPEVAGEAAILVDPTSVAQISRGFEQLIAERPRLVKAGLARAREFNWEKTARETKEFYEKIVTTKKPVS